MALDAIQATNTVDIIKEKELNGIQGIDSLSVTGDSKVVIVTEDNDGTFTKHTIDNNIFTEVFKNRAALNANKSYTGSGTASIKDGYAASAFYDEVNNMLTLLENNGKTNTSAHKTLISIMQSAQPVIGISGRNDVVYSRNTLGLIISRQLVTDDTGKTGIGIKSYKNFNDINKSNPFTKVVSFSPDAIKNYEEDMAKAVKVK